MHQTIFAAALLAAATVLAAVPAGAQGTGTIVGHIKLKGLPPANPLIRMGADPKCGAMNKGTRPVQEIVVAGADGSLANAFVHLTGAFPAAPGAPQTVVLTQKNCVYSPRVVGVRAGQAVSIRNDDNLMHNVHGLSAKGQGFNTSQPKAGMVYVATLKNEVMVHLKCDVHSWMNAYIGVVPNSFYAVTDGAGAFTIANVPAGKRTVSVWHERYGQVTGTVDVKPSQKATLELTYPGANQKAAAAFREIVVPADASEILIHTSTSE